MQENDKYTVAPLNLDRAAKVLAGMDAKLQERWLTAAEARLVPRGTDDERRMKLIVRLMPKDPAMAEEIDYLVAHRLALYRKQKEQVVDIDGDEVLSGGNYFGSERLPRSLNEPERLESKFQIADWIVGKTGEHKGSIVTLVVWEDMKCQVAIAEAKSMVARVCAAHTMKVNGKVEPTPINFSTRMQTEVQTRAVLMWLQLRGSFFWDEENKSFSTSLYFDKKSKVLRRIKSDDFEGWLHDYSRINQAKSDWATLMNDINALAFNPDVARPCRPRSLFNRRKIGKDDFIYVSCGDSEMMKIGASADGQNVTIVPNGTDDVVFLSGNTLEAWELLDDDGEDPFKTCPPFSTANYMSPHGATIAKLWVLALAACQASFPAILFIGKARSGKTRFSKAICELFGCRNRSASVDPGTAGKKDFWTCVNGGGIINFDNVDTRIDWFSDAMQQACTDGSFESRTLFKDNEITTLRANARIILTSNNPMFASESGLSDRLQIVRLLPFNGKNGKEVSDDDLTIEVKKHRNAVLTWMVRTISRALNDCEKVESNVNFRHPDYAKFALRCARSLGEYDEAVLALKSAEFDKALITVQTNTTVNYIFEALRYFFKKKTNMLDDRIWHGKSGEMLKLILESHPQLVGEDGKANRLAPTDVSVGKMLAKYIEQLAVVFDIDPPKTSAGEGVKYTFKGFSTAYKNNVFEDDEELTKDETQQNDDLDDIF